MSIEFTFVPGASKKAGAFFFDPISAGRRLAQTEEAGFERVIVDDHGGVLANFDIAAYAARISSALQIVLTHWAGAITPVVAARQLAALDTRIGGRLILRILADGEGGPDDSRTLHPTHVETLQRTDEYLMLLKRLWLNSRPFDFEGAFHSFRQGFVADKGMRAGEIPLRMRGNSGTAIQVAARHADVFELSPGSVGYVRQQIERVRRAAAQYGRSQKIGFALPVHLGGVAPKGPTVAAKSGSANLAVSFLAYIEAGITEFMVSGIDDEITMRLFGERVITVLRNTVRRNETLGSIGSPAIQPRDDAAPYRLHAGAMRN